MSEAPGGRQPAPQLPSQLPPPPPRPPLTAAQIERALRLCNQVARQARELGHHPFGALLLAADGETVLDTQGNIDAVNHAEATLARRVASRFGPEELWNCTLVSTAEPCAMCAGTQYWANIGRLVYGISEQQLLRLTGDNAQNPTMNLPCRAVFSAGQKPIEVIGPVAALEQEIIAPHQGFWR